MDQDITKSFSNDDSYEGNLGFLRELLEDERTALINGDATSVAKLAVKKESLVTTLARQGKDKSKSSLSPQIVDLANAVSERAKLNHELLKQMYQHYHGMMELFRRISGQSQTYGRDGMVSIQSGPMKSSKATV